MGHQAGSGRQCERVEEQARFDPYVGAAVLKKLADLTSCDPPRWVRPDEPPFKSAVGVLSDAKIWLERYRTPFEDFAGDLLLLACEYEIAIATDTFAATLTSAALEVVTIARLVELRDVRRVRCSAIESRPQPNAQPFDGRATENEERT